MRQNATRGMDFHPVLSERILVRNSEIKELEESLKQDSNSYKFI